METISQIQSTFYRENTYSDQKTSTYKSLKKNLKLKLSRKVLMGEGGDFKNCKQLMHITATIYNLESVNNFLGIVLFQLKSSQDNSTRSKFLLKLRDFK